MLDVVDQAFGLVLDRMLGSSGRFLDRGHIRGDGLRQFAHLAVDQRFDLVRVMSSLLVGVEVLLDVGIDLGKELAHVVVADPCTESSHRRLQVRESLVCTLGRSLVVAAEQLVYAKPRQHQVLERFAGKHHGVAVGGPADGPALQLLDLRAQFHSGRIKHVLCQLVLLPAQHNDLVEIPGISLELLCRVYELCALVRVQGNCDTLVQVILERARIFCAAVALASSPVSANSIAWRRNARKP